MKSDVKGMSSQSGEDQNTDWSGDKKHFALFWFVTAVLRSIGKSYHKYSLMDRYFSFNYDEITVFVQERSPFYDVTICNMGAVYSERYEVVFCYLN